MLKVVCLWFSIINNGSILFRVELVIIIGVVIYQIYRSNKILKEINLLKHIFQNPLRVRGGIIERDHIDKKAEEAISEIKFTDELANPEIKNRYDKNYIDITVVETGGKNPSIIRIRDSINAYLLANYGLAVNFGIIKDIIDREIDTQDEEIEHNIPTPLYLGLAATMIGIIFGLFSIPDLAGGQFEEGINALINGVKVAMIASLIGLSCTTYLSSGPYKKAKTKLLIDKNSQISYLQAQLLPKLIKTEDTGIFGLIASLDRFTQTATKISDEVLIAANQTGENIELQHEVIDKVSSLDIIKISETNLELFKRIENNIGTFHLFTDYISELTQISNNLKEFSLRTLDINRVVNKIDYDLEANSRLTRFLTEHFEKIESVGKAAAKAVDLSDMAFKESLELLKEGIVKEIENTLKAVNFISLHFKTSIEELKKEVDERIAQLNRDATQSEIQLKEIYNEIGIKLNQITKQHLNQLQSAYSNAIPQFSQLDNLQILPKIQTEITTGVSQIQNESSSNISKLIVNLNVLNNSLNEIISTISNNDILHKLDALETNYQKHTSEVLRQIKNESELNRNALIDTVKKLSRTFKNKPDKSLRKIPTKFDGVELESEGLPIDKRGVFKKKPFKGNFKKWFQNRIKLKR